MKILKQFGIILLITFLGEGLKSLLPLPIPASIYGMVILLAALMSGVLKLESVREAGEFLIEIMPILFVPAAVGLLDSWGQLRPILIPAIVITVIITVLVMAVTGQVTQVMIRHRKVGSRHE